MRRGCANKPPGSRRAISSTARCTTAGRQSEAIRGNQRQSEAIRGHQRRVFTCALHHRRPVDARRPAPQQQQQVRTWVVGHARDGACAVSSACACAAARTGRDRGRRRDRGGKRLLIERRVSSIRGNQRQSERLLIERRVLSIRGNPRQSEAIRGSQRRVFTCS
jgi:hypothetical protein